MSRANIIVGKNKESKNCPILKSSSQEVLFMLCRQWFSELHFYTATLISFIRWNSACSKVSYLPPKFFFLFWPFLLMVPPFCHYPKWGILHDTFPLSYLFENALNFPSYSLPTCSLPYSFLFLSILPISLFLFLRFYLGTPEWVSRSSACLQLGSWSRGPGIELRWAPCPVESLLLPFLLPLPPLVLSPSLSQNNKNILKKFKHLFKGILIYWY